MSRKVTMPTWGGGETVQFLNAIVYLNDINGWTLDQIATWLESLPEGLDQGGLPEPIESIEEKEPMYA
jgi:hypothetical protein